MNAKQIADELENIYWIQGDGKGKPFQQYADFVRQQHSELKELKLARLADLDVILKQRAEIELLFKEIPEFEKVFSNEPVAWTVCLDCGQRVTGDSIHTCSPQLKTLTDEEIANTWDDVRKDATLKSSMKDIQDFARAILRKAQEKC